MSLLSGGSPRRVAPVRARGGAAERSDEDGRGGARKSRGWWGASGGVEARVGYSLLLVPRSPPASCDPSTLHRDRLRGESDRTTRSISRRTCSRRPWRRDARCPGRQRAATNLVVDTAHHHTRERGTINEHATTKTARVHCVPCCHSRHPFTLLAARRRLLRVVARAILRMYGRDRWSARCTCTICTRVHALSLYGRSAACISRFGYGKNYRK